MLLAAEDDGSGRRWKAGWRDVITSGMIRLTAEAERLLNKRTKKTKSSRHCCVPHERGDVCLIFRQVMKLHFI